MVEGDIIPAVGLDHSLVQFTMHMANVCNIAVLPFFQSRIIHEIIELGKAKMATHHHLATSGVQNLP